MKWLDRIALFLWRDRYDYDPAIGRPGAQHNVSLWTRLAPARKRLQRLLLNGPLWLAFLAGAFAIAAALLPMYLDGGRKSDQQVDAGARELLLKCIEQSEGVFLCRRQ